MKDISIDCGSSGDKLWESFWKQHKNLILQEAKRKYGTSLHENEEDCKHDAYVVYCCWKAKHKRSKGAKPSTSYAFYLKKYYSDEDALNPIVRAPETKAESEGKSPDSESIPVIRASRDDFSSYDEDLIAPEERLFYSLDPSDEEPLHQEHDLEGVPPQTQFETSGAKWTVALDSIAGIVSSELLMTIRELCGYKAAVKKSVRNKLTSDSQSQQAYAAKLRTLLSSEVASAGYRLYIGVAINGSRNSVLVAARNKSDACHQMMPYGKLVELKESAIPRL